jgi:arthrofactin-type cyclic lipopeptide synthetase C
MSIEHDPLIPIQHGVPERTIVFCIPGAGANVACFFPLASRLGSDVTVYGLQPRGLDGESEPHSSVEDAAECQLRAIRALGCEKPLHLIGHSFGGWIAFEMAAKHRSAGGSVAPLMLLDARAPTEEKDAPRHGDELATLLRLIEILEQICEQSLDLSPGDLLDRSAAERIELLRCSMATRRLVSARARPSAIEAMFRVFSTNLETTYRPSRIYPDRACMILAREEHPLTFSEPPPRAGLETWRRFAPKLEATDAPGNHMTMLAERHAGALSDIILKRWAES